MNSNKLRECFLVALAFSLLLAVTRPVTLSDTPYYAFNIAEHLGKSPFGRGNTLWEFGHLLWRPLGWSLATLGGSAFSALTDWTPYMQASASLMLVSLLSSVVNVVVWYLMLTDWTTSRTAALVTLAMACTHPVWLLSQTGTAYIPGLACLSLSLYFLRKNASIKAAVFYALSALVWFPYVLAGLGLAFVAAFPGDLRRNDRETFSKPDFRQFIRFAVISATVLIGAYCLGGAARHLKSAAEVKAWYDDSGHQWAQSNRLLRAATGVPRSFYFLGKEGILFKRFLRHDPYAPVTIPDLAPTGLKLAAFYVFVLCLLHELWRRSATRWPLVALLAGLGPVLYFAIFMFEPGSPERYLPALPFLVLSVGWMFRDFPANRRVAQMVAAGVLLSVALNNGYAFIAPRVNAENAVMWRRVAGLRQRIGPSVVAFLVSNQDDLEAYAGRNVFEAINRPGPLKLYDIVEPGTLRMLQWREEFAFMTLKTWEKGGEVWITKRVRSARPKPEWNWVEADHPYEIWADISKFVSSLPTDQEEGDEDGFARLVRNDATVGYLKTLSMAYKAPAVAKQE